MRTRTAFLLIVLCVLTTSAFAAYERGLMVREAVLYISPDLNSTKLANVGRGREVTVFEHSNGWARITATVREGDDFSADKDVSGWIQDKGIITNSTPNGDQVVYGEAVDSENQASSRGGRKGAAGDAYRLYLRLPEYFPNSPFAGEAMYRAADIKWQIEKADQSTKKSSKQRDPHDRLPIDEEMMKRVIKKFPNTKWADLAAYNLIDNKLCGEWDLSSKCPEKEADIYERYATEHPESPKTPEAIYNAAWRWSTLITIYPLDGQAKKVPEAKQRALALAQRLIAKNVNPDWTARAQRLVYMVQQDIPTYGNRAD